MTVRRGAADGADLAGGDCLEVRGVTKRFNAKIALDGISFAVRPGEIFGVLGPNGAGKSTLLNMLSGLIEPDEGEIRVFGAPFRRHRGAILSRMNIASPYAALPGTLTVNENLSVYAGLYGVKNSGDRIRYLLELFGVAACARSPISRLSSGQTIRVGLCKALLSSPEILLLDEPTVYLDEDFAARTREQISHERSAHGMTIVLTSHDLDEVETMCDRILLLDGGRAVAVGTPLEVTRLILGHGRERAALKEAFLKVAAAGR